MDKEFKVDFIGVGFSRSGTTWIGKCLADHPEICFSNPKELHFFNRDADLAKGREFYAKYFSECSEEAKIYGEFTPEYYMVPDMAQRIKNMFPEAKLIFSMRNPMERAFSHYVYRKRKTGKPKQMNDIFNESDLRLGAQVIPPGYYAKHLRSYLEAFPKENILLLIHDDAKSDPKAFIKQIYQFLGVDDTFVSPSLLPETNKSKNVGYKRPWIQHLYAKRQDILQYKWGQQLRLWMKSLGLTKISSHVLNTNIVPGVKPEKEEFPEEVRERLREIYKQDIAELSKLMNRDLSFWK